MDFDEKNYRRKRIESKKKKDIKKLEQSAKKHETYDRTKERFSYKQYLLREEST